MQSPELTNYANNAVIRGMITAFMDTALPLLKAGWIVPSTVVNVR